MRKVGVGTPGEGLAEGGDGLAEGDEVAAPGTSLGLGLGPLGLCAASASSLRSRAFSSSSSITRRIPSRFIPDSASSEIRRSTSMSASL